MKGWVSICVSILALMVLFSVGYGEEKMWVSSEGAKLQEDKTASSGTIKALPLGAEVTVLEKADRWYRALASSGEEGWIYRGKLSQTPPEQKSKEGSENALSGLLGSGIKVDEADSSRSIRGLSPEAEVYADNRKTPMNYRNALDRVLALGVTGSELETFLKDGKIGEYSQ